MSAKVLSLTVLVGTWFVSPAGAQDTPVQSRRIEMREANEAVREGRSHPSCAARRRRVERALDQVEAGGGSLRVLHDARERLDDCIHDASAPPPPQRSGIVATPRTRVVRPEEPIVVRNAANQQVGGPLVAHLRSRVADVSRCRRHHPSGLTTTVNFQLSLDATGHYSNISASQASAGFRTCMTSLFRVWRVVNANRLHQGRFRVRMDLDALAAGATATAARAPVARPAPAPVAPPRPVAPRPVAPRPVAPATPTQPTARARPRRPQAPRPLVVIAESGHEAFGPVPSDFQTHVRELQACRAENPANVPSNVELHIRVDIQGRYTSLDLPSSVSRVFWQCIANAMPAWRVQGANRLHAGRYRILVDLDAAH